MLSGFCLSGSATGEQELTLEHWPNEMFGAG